MTDFYVGEDDRLPLLVTTLEDANGAINLTGATVVVYARKRGSDTKWSGSATITDAATGAVSYAWAATDTQLPGRWWFQWKVTIGGKTLTVPNNGSDEVWINEFFAGEVN